MTNSSQVTPTTCERWQRPLKDPLDHPDTLSARRSLAQTRKFFARFDGPDKCHDWSAPRADPTSHGRNAFPTSHGRNALADHELVLDLM